MLIYILNIISIPIWYCIFYMYAQSKVQIKSRYYKQAINNKRNKAACLTINMLTLQMIFIAGYRGISVGTDTINYYSIFRTVLVLPWSRLPSYYMEIGYSFINKIVATVFGDFQWVLLLCATVTMFSVNSIIKKTSSNKIMSLFLFITLGYFASMMNVMRQYLALSFILYSYYLYVWMKKKKIAYVLIFIATLIHSASIIIIPVYILYSILYNEKLKESWIIKILAITVGIVMLFMLSPIMQYMSVLGIKDYDLLFTGNVTINIISMNMIIKIVLSMIYISIPKDRITDKNELQGLQFLNYINIISCIVNVASSMYPLLSRFNIFFALPLIIFIPNILRYIKIKKNYINSIIYIGFIALWLVEMQDKDIVPWIMYGGV